MNKEPFSLDKLQYETIRRQKRRNLIKWSITPAIIVFLAALWFVLPGILTMKAIEEYKKDNFESARNWLTPLTLTSPEPFVIAFNSGTVDTQLGRYEIAEKELTRALALAPPDKRCMTAQNLVASLNTHAKSVKSDTKQAKTYVSKARTIIQANQDCFKGSSGSGGGSASSGADAESQSPSESQQQQLQQKEQEGRERKEQFAKEEVFNPEDPKIKPW